MDFGADKKTRDKASRIKCIGNQKQIGTAFRVFASDNDDKYPLETTKRETYSYIVPSGATNSQVNSTNAAARQVAQAMWNELQSPNVLLCPSDRARHSSNRVSDFLGLAGIDD